MVYEKSELSIWWKALCSKAAISCNRAIWETDEHSKKGAEQGFDKERQMPVIKSFSAEEWISEKC